MDFPVGTNNKLQNLWNVEVCLVKDLPFMSCQYGLHFKKHSQDTRSVDLLQSLHPSVLNQLATDRGTIREEEMCRMIPQLTRLKFW